MNEHECYHCGNEIVKAEDIFFDEKHLFAYPN